MSFDTTFDYTNAKVHLDSIISTHQTNVDEFQGKIDDLAGITGYTDRIDTVVNRYTSQKNTYAEIITRYQSVKDEITAVEALSVDDKEKLYDFYVIAQEQLSNWMVRMLFNYNAMLADADLTNILTDVTNTEDQKHRVCELICMSYPIERRAAEIILHIE